MAINTKDQGWVALAAVHELNQALPADAATQTALSFTVRGKPYWSYIGQAKQDEVAVTWLIGGTLPDWGGTPLVLVIALEENDISLARSIRDQLLGFLLK